MAKSKLVCDIKIKRWAMPILYFCVLAGVKAPRWAFDLTVRGE